MYFSTAFPDLQNIKVIPNPCSDIAKLPPSRKDRSVVKLLFAGMYSPKKGIYDLIAALSAIKLDDSIELHCFGSGDLEGVKNMAADFQVSASVHVHPWLDHDTYLQKLADYDVFILPSYAEGLPMTILEAMGQGLPIISTTVGGIPSAVISNHNGYLINPGDIASLSSCIETLSTNPDMRYEMGVNSWNIAKERFSLGAIRGLWKNLYGNTHIINRRLSGKYYSNNQ